MTGINEKRKFQRMDIAIPLRYKELSGNSYLTRGTLTKNISEGGTRFISGSFYALAKRLIIEMNLPTLETPVKMISKVAWIKKLPVGNDYEIGNQFLAMTKEDDTRFSSFMKDVIKSSKSAY